MTRSDKWLTAGMVICWILLFGIIASHAIGAQPKLSVAVDAQGYATVKADLPKGTAYNWSVVEIDGQKRLLCLLWVDGQRARMAIYTPSFADYQPGPTPDPQPDPKPDPQPIPPVPVGKLWTVIVQESSTLTPAQGKIVTSKAIADYVASKGHHKAWVYDKDATDETSKQPVQLKDYVLRAKSLPFLFLVSEAGVIVFEGPLPNSEAAVIDLLKKFGG